MTFLQILVLLENIGMPAASWLGISIAMIVAISGFLIRDAYATVKSEIKDLKKALEDHEEEDKLIHSDFDKNLSDTNTTILKEINAVLVKLAEFKRHD